MEKFRVLLVDDEEQFVRTLAERLQMRDFDLDVALDGEEALVLMQERTPDVVVLDLRMPGIGGADVLRWIKGSYPQTQIIILTAHGIDMAEKDACLLGAFDYLLKPVDIERLIRTLEEAWRNRRKEPTVA